MLPAGFRLSVEPPSAEAFARLRDTAGWGDIEPQLAVACVRGSLVFACIYQGSELVAMARVVGDGVLFFYVQDVVVAPPHRRKGLGRQLLASLHASLDTRAPPGSSVALLAAKGAESFYQGMGYQIRDGRDLGFALSRSIGGAP